MNVSPMSTSSMSLAATVDRLKQLVAGLDVDLDADQIDETMFIFEGGLGLDSFAIVELIVAIEREFGIEFPEQALTPESFHDLTTLGAVIAGQRACPQ